MGKIIDITPERFALATAAQVEELVVDLIRAPQVPCQLVHHFGNGVYIREIHMPAGAVVAGFNHRHDHTNVVLKGALVMHSNGVTMEINGPTIFNWGGGRKIGHILEDTVWQNVHAIDTDDLDEIEDFLYEKSDYEKEFIRGLQEGEWMWRESDRDDFWKLSKEEIFCPHGDIIPIPEACRSVVHIRKSQIDGKGVFLSHKVEALENIVPLRLNGAWTKAAQFLNHSTIPSAFVVKADNGDVHLLALRDIHNGNYGQASEEITVDYRQATQVLGGIL